jgi:hypothetical protein
MISSSDALSRGAVRIFSQLPALVRLHRLDTPRLERATSTAPHLCSRHHWVEIQGDEQDRTAERPLCLLVRSRIATSARRHHPMLCHCKETLSDRALLSPVVGSRHWVIQKRLVACLRWGPRCAAQSAGPRIQRERSSALNAALDFSCAVHSVMPRMHPPRNSVVNAALLSARQSAPQFLRRDLSRDRM